MTIMSSKKQQRKHDQFLEVKNKQRKAKNRKRMFIYFLKILSIICRAGLLAAGLFMSGKPSLLCILGFFWAITIITFLNWRLNPNGTTFSLRQIGKSGTFQSVRHENLNTFIVCFAISIILSLIILPI